MPPHVPGEGLQVLQRFSILLQKFNNLRETRILVGEVETKKWPSVWVVRSVRSGQSPGVQVVCLGEHRVRDGAVRAGPACDTGEVAVLGLVGDDGPVGIISTGVPGVGEERSQWVIEPSEPPGRRMGCTWCHATSRAISW